MSSHGGFHRQHGIHRRRVAQLQLCGFQLDTSIKNLPHLDFTQRRLLNACGKVVKVFALDLNVRRSACTAATTSPS